MVKRNRYYALEIPIHGAMTERAGRDFRGESAGQACYRKNLIKKNIV